MISKDQHERYARQLMARVIDLEDQFFERVRERRALTGQTAEIAEANALEPLIEAVCTENGLFDLLDQWRDR